MTDEVADVYGKTRMKSDVARMRTELPPLVNVPFMLLHPGEEVVSTFPTNVTYELFPVRVFGAGFHMLLVIALCVECFTTAKLTVLLELATNWMEFSHVSLLTVLCCKLRFTPRLVTTQKLPFLHLVKMVQIYPA